jgi:hypothetical protein
MFHNPVAITALGFPLMLLIVDLARHLMPRWLTNRLGWAHLTLKDWKHWSW